jgi:hypothetical protein
VFREIMNPDLYHGYKKRNNYFEGWYFKICDSEGINVLAFIPGILLGKVEEQSHSFIQVVNGRENRLDYLSFEKDSFRASGKVMEFIVDKCCFSLRGISIDIDRPQLKIKGRIEYKNVVKWQDSIINPGSMGFYNYLIFMQCYSQVCAMDIDISGSFEINGEAISFDRGKGYIEKNWGQGFSILMDMDSG